MPYIKIISSITIFMTRTIEIKLIIFIIVVIFSYKYLMTGGKADETIPGEATLISL